MREPIRVRIERPPSNPFDARTKSEVAGLNELRLDAVRNDAALEPLVEQALDGAAAALSIVERELVDPHPDEAVGQLWVHVARELHGVRERVAPVVERELNRLAQVVRDAPDGLWPEVAPDDVAAHRERQALLLLPPLAEVYDLLEPEPLVEELPLVDEQAGVGLALPDGAGDLVGGGDHVLQLRAEDAQREEGARHRAGHGDFQVLQVFDLVRLARDDDGAVALADGSTVREQDVLVRDVGVGVED